MKNNWLYTNTNEKQKQNKRKEINDINGKQKK